MLDIGWSELILIGVVALIVVGPRDLPEMFRTLGRFTAKARSMAREFSRAMENAAKEVGIDDVARDLKDVASKKSLGLDALERAADRFEKWEPKLPSARPLGPETQALADARAAEIAQRGTGLGTEAETPASRVVPAGEGQGAQPILGGRLRDRPAPDAPVTAPSNPGEE